MERVRSQQIISASAISEGQETTGSTETDSGKIAER